MKKLRNESLNVDWEGRERVVGGWVVKGEIGGRVEWTWVRWGVFMKGMILIEILIKNLLGPNRLFHIARVDFPATTPSASAEEKDAAWM